MKPTVSAVLYPFYLTPPDPQTTLPTADLFLNPEPDCLSPDVQRALSLCLEVTIGPDPERLLWSGSVEMLDFKQDSTSLGSVTSLALH